MPKQPSEKQLAARKALGEAAKARAAAKRELKATLDVNRAEPVAPVQDAEVNVSDLMRQVRELQAAMFTQSQTPAPQGPQYGNRGLIGTHEKYIVDPANYPDPRQRLASEPRLARFAFPMNYELEWTVSVTEYTTIDNMRVREPKFTLELNRIMLDEFTGETTPGRYTICRGIFHEDPEAALVVAREQGLDVDNFGEKEFLNEMRYLRMRDWLTEAFYPPAPSAQKNKREMVIDNKLVDYFEVNSEGSSKIPFDDLDKKLKV